MRRSANRFAVLLAAGVVMGCTPETSTPPATVPVRVDEVRRPDLKSGAGSGITKKKKEPGLGGTMPRASARPNPAL
jgi:hypothetical protein